MAIKTKIKNFLVSLFISLTLKFSGIEIIETKNNTEKIQIVGPIKEIKKKTIIEIRVIENSKVSRNLTCLVLKETSKDLKKISQDPIKNNVSPRKIGGRKLGGGCSGVAFDKYMREYQKWLDGFGKKHGLYPQNPDLEKLIADAEANNLKDVKINDIRNKNLKDVKINDIMNK